jgi:hypothetical protein
MKFSKSNNRDFKFYMKNRHEFNFSGTAATDLKHVAIYSREGVDGKTAFFNIENNGVNKPTRHPNILTCLLMAKASVNFNIKMWAEGRADGLFPLIEFKEFIEKNEYPDWVYNAVENQKRQFYKKS